MQGGETAKMPSNGWVLYNEFNHSVKFRQQTLLYVEASEKRCGRLVPVSNTELLRKLSSTRPDYVLFLDKDLYLAERLETFGIPVFNSSESIRLCDDKMLMYERLLSTGIRMPETIPVPLSYESVDWTGSPFPEYAAETLGFPMIVKCSSGSFGRQVWLVDSMAGLIERLNAISPARAIVQKFISYSKGRDVRIQIIDGKAVAAMKRHSETDFRANLSSGGIAESYCPSEAEKDMAAKACGALGLLFGGVDLLFGEDGAPYLCEVNSNAHIKNLLACTGVNAADAVIEAILSRI